MVLPRADIVRVHDVIRPYIRHTPVLHASGADVGLAPVPLTFKLELTQHSGSFKARGAFANLLTRPIPPAGVVAASGGNHGIAVAYAAMRFCGMNAAADDTFTMCPPVPRSIICFANTRLP